MDDLQFERAEFGAAPAASNCTGCHQPIAGAGHTRCSKCEADVPPALVSCPACHALIHAERLKSLAEAARAAAFAGLVVALGLLMRMPVPGLP